MIEEWKTMNLERREGRDLSYLLAKSEMLTPLMGLVLRRDFDTAVFPFPASAVLEIQLFGPLESALPWERR
jgi:hypothetical protein